MMSEEFPGVTYLRTTANIGVAARNMGIQRSQADIVVTLDDDISGITSDDIAYLVGQFENHHKLGAMNFKVVDHATGSLSNWVHHRNQDEWAGRRFTTYEITEGAVAFRRMVFEKSGYYPEHFFLSHEGPDLAFRIMEAGYDVVYSPMVTVLHRHSRLGRQAWFNYYYDTRNLLWLAARNFPISYSARYLARGTLSMLAYSLRDGYLRYWIKAMIDGVSGLRSEANRRSVLSKDTMTKIREIDRTKPPLTAQIRSRLFRKSTRL